MLLRMKHLPLAHPRGVVLVFTAGILTILAAMGMAFFALTQSSTVSATRYSDMVRAELLAQAGLNDAVAQLRRDLFVRTECAGDDWHTTQWLDGQRQGISFPYNNTEPYTRALCSTVGEDSDRYVVEIEDAAGKINLNACDNLAVVLDNLCRVIGPPLVSADQKALQPRRWAEEGAPAALYNTAANADDTAATRDRCYIADTHGRPTVDAQGKAVFGDGYALAGWRGRNGLFGSIDEVRQALTYIERNGNHTADDPLEVLEIEAKYAALKPHITTGSWVDTQSVCTGKFEWVQEYVTVDAVRHLVKGTVERSVTCQVLIDRDKSWVADDPENDPRNQRGSLRGAYLAIVNGHGQGQLRRIATNGADWIALRSAGPDESLTIVPGPISAYMIVAPEDALLEERTISTSGRTALFPRTHTDGSFVDHPHIDYATQPLCIHRAPVNINTASDKVLTALFMGINVQHGHPLSVGTAYPSSINSTTDLHDLSKHPRPALYSAGASSSTLSSPCTINVANYTDWYARDPNQMEPFLLTPKGLKRVPSGSGELVFDTTYVLPAAVRGTVYDMEYLNHHACIGTNEAHLLAMRVIIAREKTPSHPFIDRETGLPLGPAAAIDKRFDRGPFLNWDDLYFRVVKPWDDERFDSGVDAADHAHKANVARMIMANFNSNLDLLKFNPGIEWVDRFGRNFTEMEPVMTFKQAGAGGNYGPGWVRYNGDPTYCLRAMRYKSDELIDKTDLNRSTTEFSFMSNGIFEVRSTGQMVHPLTHQLLAERKVSALVKVYDVWRESTQEQFVRGTFSEAQGTSNPLRNTIGGTTSSGAVNRGRISRDRENDALPSPKFKALDTLPEPLVPLTHRLAVDTSKYGDVIDGRPTGYGPGNWPGAGNLGHDIFGRAKTLDGGKVVPDIIANGVLPARYDGQIVLAANTCDYTPGDADVRDTFLASFDGDLDTADCIGNGREQAKNPKNATTRCQDLIGLLGLLNDTEEDGDPDEARNFRFLSVVPALPKVTTAADPDPVTGDTTGRTSYWNHCSARRGDLRTEGVHMGMLGTSYKDGIIKYAAGRHLGKDQHNGPTTYAGENYDPRNPNGGTIAMWFKPEWHHDDFRHHEFFNATQAGRGAGPRSGGLWKVGRWWDNFVGSGEPITNDLLVFFEDDRDADRLLSLFGGWAETYGSNLDTNMTPPSTMPETAAYHVQPFRWHHMGCRYQNGGRCDADGAVLERCKGMWHVRQGDPRFWQPDTHPDYLMACNFVAGTWTGTSWDDSTKGIYRNFISTQRHPEGPNYNPKDMFWFSMTTYRSDPLTLTTIGAVGAPAAFRWADGGAADGTRDGPTGAISRTACFAVNPPNEATNSWLYRNFPTDGTYAVIDEYRLARKKWTSERICAEQTMSRYYLPRNPEDRSGCPFFTSQSLAESLQGIGTTCSQSVVPVRVYWNAFTPRFMHEWKLPSDSGYEREEIIASRFTSGNFTTKNSTTVPYRGPFNYPEYNRYIGLDSELGWKSPAVNPVDEYRGVDRDYPAAGTQPHSTQGVEIQLFDAGSGAIYPSAATAYTDPSANNPVGTSAAPITIEARNLHYRVIFRYPIDRNVDPRSNGGAGRTDELGRLTVNPSKHYMLDTPVFDDISVVYFQNLRFLDFRSVYE